MIIEAKLQAIEEQEMATKVFTCIDCKQEFVFRQGLYKHNKYNRCKVKKEQSAKQE